MRIVSGIDVPLADEHVIGTDPPLTPTVAGFWRRRLNPFTGRALSDRALTAEQETRAGIQRLRGQSVSAGVIAGLDVLAEPGAFGAAPADAVIQILPGSGLSRAGEDVIIGSPRRIALAELPVFARVDQLDAIAAGDPPGGTGDAPPVGDGGEGPLFPPRPRRTGPRLGQLLSAAAAADLPRAAVLVAEPVTAVLQANPRDACPPDPRDDPYDDLQRIDGCRLSLFFWPSEMRARAGGPDYALPAPGPARRNRLAYGAFGVERILAGDDMHPWEGLGVPLALVGFRDDWRLDFIDRAAVLRMGGQPKPRTPLVPMIGTPLLWQARVAQFMEHLAALPDFLPATFAASFRQLPPVGFLPAEMIDLRLRRQAVFPAGFTLSAAPVPIDQIELAVEESGALEPIGLDVPDAVELLAPVPAAVYEPGLLEVAAVDPAFARAMARYVADRTNWLVRRELVRRRRDLLRDSATGQRPAWPAEDIGEDEVNPYPTTRGPVTCTRVRRIDAGNQARWLRMLGAGSSLTLVAGDRVYVWVRIADPANLTGLSLGFGQNTRSDGTGDFGFRVFWGDATNLPIAVADPAIALRRQGPLPAAGGWIRLDASVDARWTAAGAALAGVVANGIELAQRGGSVDWGPVGRVTADGVETVWIADDAPQGATLLEPFTGATWPQRPAGAEAIVTEAEFGTVETAGVRTAISMRDLRGRWPQGFLAPDFALLDEGGIDGFVADIEARLKATNDTIDLGFVRARADIYRVRQLMLGADAASRLVTSPALADLSVREESARARSIDLSGYIKTAYQIDAERDPDEPLETRPKSRTPSTAQPAATPATNTVGGVRMMAAVTTTQFMTMTSFVQPVTLFGAVKVTSQRAAQQASVSLGALRAMETRTGIANVRAQLAIPGLVERTATVAERLKPSPSVEAYNAALAGKLTALNTLANLLGDANAGRPRGIALGDLPAPGYRFRPAGDPPAPRIRGSVADVLDDMRKPAGQRDYDDEDMLGAGGGRHEADYFNAAVRAIDNAIALMRLVEGRVSLYESLVTDAREVRAELVGQIAQADARLRTIDVELEEARHDVGVASALLAEEQARIEALNAKRQATIAQHVTVVMFRRPPRADRIDELAVFDASAALAPSPVAVCLREHQAVPEEVRDYVALFRDAPVAWFPQVLDRVRVIDRLDAARAALEAARARAAAQAAARARQAASSTKLLAAVARATAAQASVLDRRRVATMQLDLGVIAAMDLSVAHRALAETASLGDLAAGDHRRPELSRLAVGELEQLGQVAACLHDAFGEAPPAIRLGWAEILSEFDAPAPLAQLAGLPRWGDLPLELRRTQQGLVDFLFSRIDRDRDEAENAINGLVRVCLLMAAHAPVDRVIPARLVAPVPARPGARLDLALDIRLARIGQVALVRGQANSIIARAVVEDLADGIARARITESFQPTVTIAAGVRIELSEARSG
jgi:hypothetical protein